MRSRKSLPANHALLADTTKETHQFDVSKPIDNLCHVKTPCHLCHCTLQKISGMGPGPVLGGKAGGQDYSLSSMLERAPYRTKKDFGTRMCSLYECKMLHLSQREKLTHFVG